MSYTGSKAQTARGAQFYIGDTASPVGYTHIGEMIAPALTGEKNNFDEVTNLDSAGEEFITTMPSSGNWNFAYNRVSSDAGQIALQASYDGNTKRPYKVVLPLTATQTTVGDTILFLGYVETFTMEGLDPKKAIKGSGSIKVTNGKTVVAGS